jgi:hypothetical protein
MSWEDKYMEAIKRSKTDQEIKNVIDKIYDDGFIDGTNEGGEEEQ